jgi:hypothetical protein
MLISVYRSRVIVILCVSIILLFIYKMYAQKNKRRLTFLIIALTIIVLLLLITNPQHLRIRPPYAPFIWSKDF